MSDPRTQAVAAMQVQQLVHALREAGWDFALVSIWRHDGSAVVFHGAGASGWEASTRITPAVPRIADNLRVLAHELDEAHRLSGAPEVVHGCTQVVGGTVVDVRAERAKRGGV
jgi:hypothetical protein